MKIEKVINDHIKVIENIPKLELEESILKLVDLIYLTTKKRNNKILVAGVGKAGFIAEILATSLASIDIPAIHVHPTDIQHGDLGLLQKGDIIINISNSGKTRELLEFITLSKNKFTDVKVISFTNNKDSEITKKSDIVINGDCKTEVEPLNIIPTLSQTVFMVLIDTLISFLLIKTRYTKYEYSFNHFGGYLGEKTNTREIYTFNEVCKLDKKVISGIYVIRNLVNSKVYVGQSTNIYKRWIEHIYQIKNKTHSNKHLQNSFNKYGFNSFQFEIIEKTIDNLDNLEITYIKKFNSLSEGYNLTSGGNNNDHYNKKIIAYNLNGDLVRIFKSIKEASETLGISREHISEILNSKKYRKSLKGFMFKYYTSSYKNKIKPYKNKRALKIDCFDLNGNYIDTFKSVHIAAKYFNIDNGSISKCINGKVSRVGNYVFKKHIKEKEG